MKMSLIMKTCLSNLEGLELATHFRLHINFIIQAKSSINTTDRLREALYYLVQSIDVQQAAKTTQDSSQACIWLEIQFFFNLHSATKLIRGCIRRFALLSLLDEFRLLICLLIHINDHMFLIND